VTSSSFPNLEGLDDLARRNGVDTRPTLVRVLTDLYIQKPAHTVEEERHYTELVLRPIDAAEPPTRAIVAHKPAAYAAAPRPVVRRLARDAIEVAEPILRNSACLTAPELIAIIEECGPRHAAAIAAREARQPASPAAPSYRSPAPHRAAASLPRSSNWRRIGPAPEQAAAAAGVGELFFAASSEERRAILANLDANEERPEPQPGPPADAVQRLEAAALARRSEELVREIERTLGVSMDTARRIVEDQSGEPLLVAARVLGIPSEVLLRILLFVNPAIGQSVPRVFDLAKLYLEITPTAALRVVASLRGGMPLRPAHQPALWDDEAESGRRAGTDSARRGLAPPVQPARREGGLPARRHGTT